MARFKLLGQALPVATEFRFFVAMPMLPALDAKSLFFRSFFPAHLGAAVFVAFANARLPTRGARHKAAKENDRRDGGPKFTQPPS